MTAATRTRIAIKFARIAKAANAAGWAVQGSDTAHLFLSRFAADGKVVDVTVTADADKLNLIVTRAGQTAVALNLTATAIIAKLSA